MKALLARALPLLRPLLGLLIVAAVVYAVASQWDEVSVAIRDMAWQSLLLALVAVVVGTLAGVQAWRTLLAEEGHPLSFVDASRVFLVGQLGKYLPGSVWSVVVQMELATRLGVPRARSFTATLSWIGLSLSSALAVGVVGMPLLGDSISTWRWVFLIVLPVALICSHPRVLTRLVDLMLSAMRKAPLPHTFTWKGVAGAFGWLLVTWLCFGVQLWLLANSLGSPGWTGLVRCVSGFALALGAGIIFIIAPSGAGARELIIVAALAGVMTEAQALAVAVVSRMVFTVADILLAGIAAASALRLLRSPAGSTQVSDPENAQVTESLDDGKPSGGLHT